MFSKAILQLHIIVKYIYCNVKKCRKYATKQNWKKKFNVAYLRNYSASKL